MSNVKRNTWKNNLRLYCDAKNMPAVIDPNDFGDWVWDHDLFPETEEDARERCRREAARTLKNEKLPDDICKGQRAFVCVLEWIEQPKGKPIEKRSYASILAAPRDALATFLEQNRQRRNDDLEADRRLVQTANQHNLFCKNDPLPEPRINGKA